MLISSQQKITSKRRFRFLAVVEGTPLTSASAVTSMRLVFEGINTGTWAYSKQAALHHAPQPFGDLPEHVAEQQQCRRPDQRGHEIGDLKVPIWHLEYPGSERHGSSQRSEKSPDENARYAPLLHKDFAARQNLRIARQRPHVRDLLLVPVAEPIGDPIAKRSTDRTGDPDRPEADASPADHRADRDQRTPGRDKKRNKGKRFTECQHQNDRCGPGLMIAHEVSQGVRKTFHFRLPFPAPI